MIWTLAPCLSTLRGELNAWRPHRDKSSDGAIGDFAHAHTASDHNPNALGVVCAYDIDTDLDGTDDSNDPEMDALAEHLRTHPHPNMAMLIYKANDPRFGIATREPKYGYPAWTWRPYTKDPHISHLHISVGEGLEGQRLPGTYDDLTPWLADFNVPILQPPKPPPLPPIPPEDIMYAIIQREGRGDYLLIATEPPRLIALGKTADLDLPRIPMDGPSWDRLVASNVQVQD